MKLILLGNKVFKTKRKKKFYVVITVKMHFYLEIDRYFLYYDLSSSVVLFQSLVLFDTEYTYRIHFLYYIYKIFIELNLVDAFSFEL